MFDNIINFFKKFSKDTKKDSKDTAKERLHLVLMQDRANVSADFLEMMKQEIIEVIKKYIDVDENSIDVKLTNKVNSDGTTGAPALYANIPIVSLKDETKKVNIERKKANKSVEEKDTEKQEKEDIGDESAENAKEQDTTLADNNTKNKNIEEEKVEDVGAQSVRNTIEQDPIAAEENAKIENVESKPVENKKEQEPISSNNDTENEVENKENEQQEEVLPDENIEPEKEEVEEEQKAETSEKTEVK